MYTLLIKKIRDLLTANTLLENVYIYEVEQLKGDPAAVISPSGNQSDYRTNSSNVRVYAFNIRLFISRSTRSKEDADEAMRGLVDSILDDFDSNYTFSDVTNPTGYTVVNVFAMPSQWGYSGQEDEYRVAEINVQVRVDVDVTRIGN